VMREQRLGAAEFLDGPDACCGCHNSERFAVVCDG
jgi:hypothetical protein